MCLALAVDDIEIRWPDPRKMTDVDLMEQAIALALSMQYFCDDPPGRAGRYHHLAGLREVRAEFNRRRTERKKI